MIASTENNHNNNNKSSSVSKEETEMTEEVVKYLTKCGLSSEMTKMITNGTAGMKIEESSLKLLIELSQRSNKSSDNEDRSKGSTDTCIVNEEKEKEDTEEGTSTAVTNQHITINTNTIRSSSHKDNLNPSASIPNFESRDYEQLLAHYNLDSKSFNHSMKKSTSSPNLPSPTSYTGTGTGGTQSSPSSTSSGTIEWQQNLTQSIQQQNEQLKLCQEQIQSLARLIAQDMVERRQMWDQIVHNNNNHTNHTNHHRVGMTTIQPTTQTSLQADNDLNENNDKQSLLFIFLEKFFANLFHFPMLFYTYITSTKLYHILITIQNDMNAFRQNGQLRDNRFIHIDLIMKIGLFCFFLYVRLEHYEERMKRELSREQQYHLYKSGLDLVEVWNNRRMILLLVGGIVFYLFKTGIYKLLYHVIVKDNVVRRVWRENRNNGEDAGLNGENNNNRNNNNSPRRGRRDRHPVNVNNNDRNDENVNVNRNHNPNNDNNDNEGQRGGGLGNIVRYIQDQTFIGGHIDRPMHRGNHDNGQRQEQPPPIAIPREQVLLEKVIDSAKDVVYIFGSFFLSLFPMWHPRARELNRNSDDDVVTNNDDNNGNNRNQDDEVEAVE